MNGTLMSRNRPDVDPCADVIATAPTWSAMLERWRGERRPAVVTATATWTGEELLARAAGAAAHLAALVPRGTTVPALVSSTPTALAYTIGGGAAGRPLAPLGPRLTARELAPCVDDLAAPVILCEPGCSALATTLARTRGCDVVVLDDAPRGDAFDEMDLRPAPGAIAFVLHTSGTTGRPKAVPYPQGRLAARVRVNAALCAVGPGAVCATGSPFHHIAGLGTYAVALAAGAAVAPLPRFTVDTWTGLGALGVTHSLTVPTMLELLLDAGALAFPSLRLLQYGAAPIHPETLRRTMEAAPGVDLVNLFGQTEGSPITCLGAGDHRRIATEGRVDLLGSVGRAVPGVEVWIEAPDGQGVGEITARGGHLVRTDADGVLRTGDLGRFDEEGYLFLAGRLGDAISRGGENVHALEVEHVLEEHPGVREAAVVGVPDRRWGEVVTAFVVPVDPAQPPAVEELRTHARARLAGFKVPTEWTFADALPRSATGKLLRRNLRPSGPATRWG
jgi:acyl-CoA synthetase (AMP-forming)/AMP-acid ligase II